MEGKNRTDPMHGLAFKSGPGLGLLENVVVLDMTTSIAGPYATQLLADLGATVLKIERPGVGDDARAWGPPFLDGQSLWFMSVNRNKHSVTLDYSNDQGRELLLGLVAKADVMMVNLVSRVQRKLGIDAERLRAVRPELVHASLTGFGLEGQRSDLPCYDLIAEGYSGVMDLTGESDALPQKVGTPAADLLAGQDAAMAILAALIQRQHNGKGCTIDVSMVESMARFMAPRLMPYLGSGEVPRRSGGRDSVIAIYQVFNTADHPITLGLGNDAIWRRFWAAVEQPATADNPNYASNSLRREHRLAIVQTIEGLLSTKPRQHWLAVLGAARIPCGPIYSADEVTADAELRDRGLFYAVQTEAGLIPQVGLGIRFDGSDESCRLAPQALGADTESVLVTRLGLSRERIAELREQHII
jgi:crotonobetainyl-CoA:carnitine CoA-transferase CaiB-like acyl-CoA transferase